MRGYVAVNGGDGGLNFSYILKKRGKWSFGKEKATSGQRSAFSFQEQDTLDADAWQGLDTNRTASRFCISA
jgi:hypothetical protein